MQKRQRGQSLSEYRWILGLIAVTSIAVVGTLGSTIRSQVAAMTQELAGMDSSGASAISTANFVHQGICAESEGLSFLTVD